MGNVVLNAFGRQYRRVANKPYLGCKQVLFALQVSLACDAKRMCFEWKMSEKHCKNIPFIYNKVLKRHEKAVALYSKNSVMRIANVKVFYRAAAWLVVYSPLYGWTAE